jgi:hypothetical protein
MTDDFKNRLERAKAMRRETIAKFRYEQVKEMPDPLPDSGLKVFLREASMMDLVFSGKLPEPLVDAIQSASKDKQDVDLKSLARNGAEFSKMVEGLILMTVVEPPIAEKADDDHIGIAELSANDRMAIFNWLNREKNSLDSFRGGQDELVPPAQPGSGIQPETEPGLGVGNGNGSLGAG